MHLGLDLVGAGDAGRVHAMEVTGRRVGGFVMEFAHGREAHALLHEGGMLVPQSVVDDDTRLQLTLRGDAADTRLIFPAGLLA